MKSIKPGYSKKLDIKVTRDDLAEFNGIVVHEVCSTFALARSIEWATRQYVLEITDDDEEGIGTSISIDHVGPAFEGEVLEIESEVKDFDGYELICMYQVKVKNRIVAKGTTGQKILKKEKIEKIFNSLP